MYKGENKIVDSGIIRDSNPILGGKLGLFVASQEEVLFSKLSYGCITEKFSGGQWDMDKNHSENPGSSDKEENEQEQKLKVGRGKIDMEDKESKQKNKELRRNKHHNSNTINNSLMSRESSISSNEIMIRMREANSAIERKQKSNHKVQRSLSMEHSDKDDNSKGKRNPAFDIAKIRFSDRSEHSERGKDSAADEELSSESTVYSENESSPSIMYQDYMALKDQQLYSNEYSFSGGSFGSNDGKKNKKKSIPIFKKMLIRSDKMRS